MSNFTQSIPQPSHRTESLVVLFRANENPYLQQIRLRLRQKKTLEVVEATSADEVYDILQNAGSALLFVCVRGFQELRKILRCLGELQPCIADRSLRVLGVTDLDDPRALTLMRGRGCIDVFPTRLIWNSLESNIDHANGMLAVRRMLNAKPLPATEEAIEIPADRPVDWTEPESIAPELDSKLKIWIGTSDPRDTRLFEARLIEYSSESMILEVDTLQFVDRQSVVLILDGPGQNPGSGSKLKVHLRVDEAIPTETGRQMLSIHLEGELEQFMEPVRKIRAQLQTKVLDFLKAARGW